MSMRYYPVCGYGILLDYDTARIIYHHIPDNEKYEDLDELLEDLWDSGVCEYISDFEGEAIKVDADGTLDWDNTEYFYSDDSIYFISLKGPQLFKAPYKNMDDLVNSLKEEVGEYFPDDFDYASRIRRIEGTTFG